MGAGNYKSNPSSRGIKLQRKRTSQGKKKKAGGGRGCKRLSGFPCAPGTDPGKLQKSPKGSRRANKSHPQKKRRVSSGLVWRPLGAARRGRRLHSPAEVRGAQAERLAGGRAGGWTPGKMPRRRARRRGFRGPAGRGAGQRAAAVRGGRGAAVHTWSAAGTEGPAARGGRGQCYGAISGRDQGSERWGGGEEAGRGAGRREWRRLRLGRSLCAGAGGGRGWGA